MWQWLMWHGWRHVWHVVNMACSQCGMVDMHGCESLCVGSFVVHSVSGCHIADSDMAPGLIVRRGLGEGSCWLTCAGTNPGQ